MEKKNIKCPYCEEVKLINRIGIHAFKVHNISAKELYKNLYNITEEPFCACGCGELTKFIGIEVGFREYKRGHKARIDNPHRFRTEETFEKLSNTRKELFEKGKLKSWCHGLTKEMDVRIKELADKGSITIKNNKEEIEKRSIRMKRNRLDGTIPTLSGEKCAAWKGGSSPVSARCHASGKLYNEWKYPKLLKAGFKCEKCESTTKLEVHHNEETMASIIHKMIAVYNPSKKKDFHLETKIVEAVVEYHLENNVSGMVICYKCHESEHPSYNYHKNE